MVPWAASSELCVPMMLNNDLWCKFAFVLTSCNKSVLLLDLSIPVYFVFT